MCSDRNYLQRRRNQIFSEDWRTLHEKPTEGSTTSASQLDVDLRFAPRRLGSSPPARWRMAALLVQKRWLEEVTSYGIGTMKAPQSAKAWDAWELRRTA